MRHDEQSEDATYQRAARFDGRRAEADAEQAYQRSRRDVYRARQDTELSVFRLQIGNQIGDVAYLGWYVALIGTRPDEALEARLDRHLARGTPVELPDAVTEMLQARRAKDAGLAPWVERRLGRLTKAELYQRPEPEAGGERTRKR